MKRDFSFSLTRPISRKLRVRRAAFTLTEMLVALAVLAVMLSVVFIPINIATNMANVGTARAGAQDAGAAALNMIRRDLQRAVRVLPNDRLAGVTDVSPYAGLIDVAGTGGGNVGWPYRLDPNGFSTATFTQNVNACAADIRASGNTSRLDLILPRTESAAFGAGVRGDDVLISYYCRRVDLSKPYDPIENPVTLFRAQMPYRYQYQDGATTAAESRYVPAETPGEANLNLSNARFSQSCNARELRWLTQNQWGEFDLSSLCKSFTSDTNIVEPVFGQHTRVLPTGVALIAPRAKFNTRSDAQGWAAMNAVGNSLVPEVSFLMRASGSVIDEVTIQISVGQYDADFVNRRGSDADDPKKALRPQVARQLVETVRCPNVGLQN